jgi:hypothetical protein
MPDLIQSTLTNSVSVIKKVLIAEEAIPSNVEPKKTPSEDGVFLSAAFRVIFLRKKR